MLCYVMLCIIYLKSTHKNRLQKTNKYRLIDAKLTPGPLLLSPLLPQLTQVKFKQQQPQQQQKIAQF